MIDPVTRAKQPKYVRLFTETAETNSSRTIQQNMVPVPVDCTNCNDSSCDMCLVGTRCYSDFNEKFVWNMHMLRGIL